MRIAGTIVHQRRGYSTDKHFGCIAFGNGYRRVDGFGDFLPFERKERRHINAVPTDFEDRLVLVAFDELDVVTLPIRTMVGSELHETDGGVLVLVPRLNE